MDSLFGLDKAAAHDENLALLATFYDNAVLAMAEGLLQEADIPYLRKERGVGGVMQIISGYSLYGTDLFVNASELSAAEEALAPLEVPFDEAVEASEEETEGDDRADGNADGAVEESEL